MTMVMFLLLMTGLLFVAGMLVAGASVGLDEVDGLAVFGVDPHAVRINPIMTIKVKRKYERFVVNTGPPAKVYLLSTGCIIAWNVPGVKVLCRAIWDESFPKS